MGKHVKLKEQEKQKWSNEKLHLDNARKIRGIYFIDLEDKEFKETIKNARKKLETSVAPAMPCKIMKKNCGSGASNKIKTRFACILEADECTRLRMGETLPNHHEDHVAGKGDNSLQHHNLVRKFIPMSQAMKFLNSPLMLERLGLWHLMDGLLWLCPMSMSTSLSVIVKVIVIVCPIVVREVALEVSLTISL